MSQTTVYIPVALRKKTGDCATVMVSGRTIREVIDSLDRNYPGIFFNLCHETGALRPYVNIFLNRKDIRSQQGLDTQVPAGATIHILQSVAGG